MLLVMVFEHVCEKYEGGSSDSFCPYLNHNKWFKHQFMESEL